MPVNCWKICNDAPMKTLRMLELRLWRPPLKHPHQLTWPTCLLVVGLDFGELIMETVNVLKDRFRVDPPEIKKAIDSLIDRDYMERNGRDAYNYLA